MKELESKADSKNLRWGFSTGSCAAAAAKAAAYMLFTGKAIDSVDIYTPQGSKYTPVLEDIEIDKDYVSCAVRKDGGDDPDITTGTLIYAKVSLDSINEGELEIVIDGGTGVGRVTKPGLDQPVGNAAINHVPRSMIEEAVSSVAKACDFEGRIKVIIYVPDGEELAKKTMNPKLGIEGGISILGTMGVVKPMSTRAIIDTIRVEVSQRKALGEKVLAVTPGNYGAEYMLKCYGYSLDKSVKCSNYIGDTIDIAIEAGFDKLLITGHIGKLIKLAGGMMNTHSSEGDCRMELLVAAALREGIAAEAAVRILDCVSTEEGIRILDEMGLCKPVMNRLLDQIMEYTDRRTKGAMEVGYIIYSNVYGELAKTDNAEKLLRKCML